MSRDAPSVLWVDDDIFILHPLVADLRVMGFNVSGASTVSEAKKIIDRDHQNVVVLDMRLPPGDEEDSFETKAGFESGLFLARWIKRYYPTTKIVGFSVAPDPDGWFRENEIPYIRKPAVKSEILSTVQQVLHPELFPRRLRAFIVPHGHDDKAKLELKNYLQNILDFEQPIILHEQPNSGRTLIEKLEQESEKVDFIFVLLTPDDIASPAKDQADLRSRARQNVIFELGLFVGLLGRTSGRVILLYKGPLEIAINL